MSYPVRREPLLIQAHQAIAKVLSQAIVVDRFLDYEYDDQGGRHAMTGISISLVDGPADTEPLVIMDHSRVSSLAYRSEAERQRIADMIGCPLDKLMEPDNAPALYEALGKLGIGLAISCIHEPYEIDPAGPPL